MGAVLEKSGGEKKNLAPVINVFNWSSDNPLKSSILNSLHFLVFRSNILLFSAQINKGLVSAAKDFPKNLVSAFGWGGSGLFEAGQSYWVCGDQKLAVKAGHRDRAIQIPAQPTSIEVDALNLRSETEPTILRLLACTEIPPQIWRSAQRVFEPSSRPVSPRQPGRA